VASTATSVATTALLPSAEMTLDLEANEVEVKVLTSLALVAESTVDDVVSIRS